MTAKDISFVIPVYNRPEETEELLNSLSMMDGDKAFEVVIVEDGSSISSEKIVNQFSDILNISYYFKPNSGPGDSRNYGMRKAKGDYFIILDSDCIMPSSYMESVLKALNRQYIDCFGGPDAAHHSFSNIQKAINFSMTSVLTTGGIRGRKNSVDTFQPRSFNMGISRPAFEATGGFGKIHPGEDPDLSIRLWKKGFKTTLFTEAFVYHKRRISWSKFYKQVHKFGLARPILNKWHPETMKLTYWFPLLFALGLMIGLIFMCFEVYYITYLYLIYFVSCFLLSFTESKSITVAMLSIWAIMIQFFGYGYGFLNATYKLTFSNKKAEELLPQMFF
ncbi:MAG: glycosyltransferase [Flavobacteriaceae bacterium]|nr:glycosyltransferase [Flavobacteriaceae bacterium]